MVVSYIELTIWPFANVPIAHVTAIPLKQSIIGEIYFLADKLNSMISVNHFLLFFSSQKSRTIRFGSTVLIALR